MIRRECHYKSYFLRSLSPWELTSLTLIWVHSLSRLMITFSSQMWSRNVLPADFASSIPCFLQLGIHSRTRTLKRSYHWMQIRYCIVSEVEAVPLIISQLPRFPFFPQRMVRIWWSRYKCSPALAFYVPSRSAGERAAISRNCKTAESSASLPSDVAIILRLSFPKISYNGT